MYTWLYMAKHGNTWQYMVIYGNIWQYMAVQGSTWLQMAVHGNAWQYMVIHSFITYILRNTKNLCRKFSYVNQFQPIRGANDGFHT